MMQFIIVFPLIYCLIKKYSHCGLIIVMLLNLIYEIVKNYIGISDAVYRLLIIRYFSLIGFGSYLYIYGNSLMFSNIKWKLFSFIGIIYIACTRYMALDPLCFDKWTKTSMLACFYIMPVIGYIILKYSQIRCSVLEFIGKASFDIFLVQMTYYAFMASKVQMLQEWTGYLICILLEIILCVFLGGLFYKFENYIYNKIVLFN